MEYSVETNIQDEMKRLRDLPTKVMAVSVMRAINDTAKAAKTIAVRQTQSQLGLKNQKFLRRNIIVRKASKTSLQGSVAGDGKAIPLANFREVSTTETGITAKLLGKSVTIKSGFRSRRLGNHYFRRISDSSRRSGLMARKIYELTGPSVPRGMLDTVVSKAIRGSIDETFPKRLGHYIKTMESRQDHRRNMVKVGRMGSVSL